MILSKEFDDLIQKGLQAKTFSLEGVEAIKDMRDKVAKLETSEINLTKKLESKDSQIDQKQTKIEETTNIIATQKQKIAKWKKREKEIKTREDNMTELETTTRMEELRRNDIFNLVKIIFEDSFRAEVITKVKSGTVPIQTRNPDGSIFNSSGNINVTETIEKTKKQDPIQNI